MRALLGALFVVLILAPVVGAEEIRGQLKKVDVEKGTITLLGGPALPGASIDSIADKDYSIPNTAKIIGPDGKEIKDGLKAAAVKAGVTITLTREKKDGVSIITQVKVGNDPGKK
ncbi:hypothetical protein AYO44_01105 [Planctomycetaceae bacterium SCGC AG-212-F19]|nr:hypothetical protein AYO44_01105 [Planctomycetaceae bacterium SCGC AG-212-F19]